ncbi:hypothetical protein TVAG_379060 [Trichomonas vaginalis G3]|uniref:DUF3447 domain-containing protein n=1 Tax=Trichomonas vaginalis (strain ATCC PRA-98 / G3) TaxID=412133 RepID=A2DB97_TRIV3|nr:spectrin binding [Trichomonas vaginalis G3]EAY22427.1 hypothetical protein TVAG_379060 [Trichomonas vaginalis G3]KAI5517626.1 spectrin binding [Trichomonas vaginalis G3]|eukprot:XP_001583413.1 hypothetical protein [Trichomonas vaginalis G3]
MNRFISDTSGLFDELFPHCEAYNDAFASLYALKTYDNAELNKIYQKIKINLIDSKISSAEEIIRTMSEIFLYNNCYLRSYFTIFKLSYEEFHPNQVLNINPLFDYFVYKEYGKSLDKNNLEKNFKRYSWKDFSLDIHQKYTIYEAIMHDNKEQFISIAENNDFDEKQLLSSEFYPENNNRYTLLELCCYYGAVDCFKFIRTKFDSIITTKCLELSFLGGNPEIMHECLKTCYPNEKCMTNAIISHNIDFVTFLMNEYELAINIEECQRYHNIQAFLVYYDCINMNDINDCYIQSINFNHIGIIEKILFLGADINAKTKSGGTVLYFVLQRKLNILAEFLLSRGISINAKDNGGLTALHLSMKLQNKSIMEFLLSHGADVNIGDNFGLTCLHNAVWNNNKEIAELLLSNGANVDAKESMGLTALHYAAMNNYQELVNLLASHGAELNAKDDNGKTALISAAEWNRKETMELLITLGADINSKDNNGKTPLMAAAEWDRIETIDFLIAHGADVKAKDNKGKTALNYAASRKNRNTIKALNEKDHNPR